jgi:hypothetical protein
MGSYKQILVLVASLVWLLVCVQGSVIRRSEGLGRYGVLSELIIKFSSSRCAQNVRDRRQSRAFLWINSQMECQLLNMAQVTRANKTISLVSEEIRFRCERKLYQFRFCSDVFGAKAGVDAKPTIGFGDAVRNDERRRRKREVEGEQQDPDARDIQNVFQQMWSAIVDGGKQIVKKVGEMIDRDAPNQQAQREQPQQTY